MPLSASSWREIAADARAAERHLEVVAGGDDVAQRQSRESDPARVLGPDSSRGSYVEPCSFASPLQVGGMDLTGQLSHLSDDLRALLAVGR
jgi:hypothetical protein